MSYQRVLFALGTLALAAFVAGCAGNIGAEADASDAGSDVDAGTVDDDAGTTGSDAGSDDDARDAGPSEPVDAGQTLPNVDADEDGLDDGDELAWAIDYLPFLSNHPDDDCPLSGIVFRARPHPDDASLVHVIYSRLYETDCGITSHVGDNEAFGATIDPNVAAPAGLVAVRAVSHQNTICERTTTCGTCEGLDACDLDENSGRPVLYASRDKHAGAVNLARGCSLLGSCFDQCELASTSASVPLVNAGEPDAPLTRNLTQNGFITTANGWSEPDVFDYDPWGDVDFGGAGAVSGDLVDDEFLTPACHASN